MTVITFDSIKDLVDSSKIGLGNPIVRIPSTPTTEPVETGPPLEQVTVPMSDREYYGVGREARDKTAIEQLLNIDFAASDNEYSGKQIIINSDRILINAASDFAFIFAKKGMSLGTQGEMHLDSDAETFVYGGEGVFLGIPTKSDNSENDKKNRDYESAVLGEKLANIIQDLFLIIKSATVVTPIGNAYFKGDVQEELAKLAKRIPEILSTSVFVEGFGHQEAEK